MGSESAKGDGSCSVNGSDRPEHCALICMDDQMKDIVFGYILYCTSEAGATRHAAIKHSRPRVQLGPASAVYVYTVPLLNTLRTNYHSYFRAIVVFASPCLPFMQY